MSLVECLDRFAWASRYVDYLEAELAPLEREYKRAEVTPKVHKGGRLLTYTLQGDLPSVPIAIGLRVSDCVHHLRATLDNLMYTIASENHTRLTAVQRRAVTFPICTDPRQWATNVVAKKTLAKIPREARTIVERLQPYHRRTATELHPLAVLRILSDLDKHRLVPAVIWSYTPEGSPRMYFGPAADSSGVIDLTGLTPAEMGSLFQDVGSARWTELARVARPGEPFLQLAIPRGFQQAALHLMFRFGFGVAEPDVLRGRRIDRLLNRVRDFVRNAAIPELAPYCPASPEEVVVAARRTIDFGLGGAPGTLDRVLAEMD